MKYEIATTRHFQKWLDKRDIGTQNRVNARLAQVSEEGHFGDHKNLGGGLSEMRFDSGGGLRLYYTIRANRVVLLVLGGNKSTQEADIRRARLMLKKLED